MSDPALLTVQPVLAVPDPAATAAYYRDVLGFRPVEFLTAAEPHICLYSGEAEIILTRAAAPVVPSHVANGYGYDAYAVPVDPAAMYRRLVASGAKVVVPLRQTDYGSSEFVIEDIDGHWIGFGTKPAELVGDNNALFHDPKGGSPKAEILCVGTELLLGEILNTNAAFIARELAGLGIGCYYQTVVGDNPDRLKQALETALSRADIVITTGGLGPTGDDLTKEIVAEYFDRELHEHEPSKENIRRIFAASGREITENNWKQALMPDGAIVLHNDRGTANGLAIEDYGKTVILLPGPPREMTAMFSNEVVPYLKQKSDNVLVSKIIHFFGIGESQLESQMPSELFENANPTVAPYAGDGEVRLRVTASAATETAAEALIDPVVESIRAQFAQYVYGVDVANLETAVVQELAEKGLTVATAESCTGGLIASRITSIPGSSDVFGYGAVTYANDAKMKMLGVSEETLAEFGAVSPQTAAEMAEGVRRLAGSDIGVATTGIAGPDGGTSEKPVGLVWLGIASERGTRTVELHLSRGYGEERNFIRHLAATNALSQVLREIRGGGT